MSFHCECSQLKGTKHKTAVPMPQVDKSSVVSDAAEALANKTERKIEPVESFAPLIVTIPYISTIRVMFRYILEGLAIAMVTTVLPKKKLNVREVATISILGAFSFCVLDLWAPLIGKSSRFGAGFGIGANLTGF